MYFLGEYQMFFEISDISRVCSTIKIADIFNTYDEIYLVQ